MIADGEAGGQLQRGVRSGRRPAEDGLSAGKREHRAVLHRQIADAAFRQKDHRGSQMRRDVGLAVGDAQYDLPVLILQPGRGHLLAVQRRRDQRRHRQRLVRGALIGDVLPVCLPGQRLPVQREGFISAHVFNAGQQGAVGQHIQLFRVFQTDAVGQAPHRAVRADNGVNPLVPGALR